MNKYEQIGTFRIAEDMIRIKAASCPKYDEQILVKAGDYPVYLYSADFSNKEVRMAAIEFDKDFTEVWHGFMLGKHKSFIPGEGWRVREYSFKSFDGHLIDTADIERV